MSTMLDMLDRLKILDGLKYKKIIIVLIIVLIILIIVSLLLIPYLEINTNYYSIPAVSGIILAPILVHIGIQIYKSNKKSSANTSAVLT